MPYPRALPSQATLIGLNSTANSGRLSSQPWRPPPVDFVTEQVRMAKHAGDQGRWRDAVDGCQRSGGWGRSEGIQKRLRELLELLKADVARLIVVVNVRDLTRLPRFWTSRHPTVMTARRLQRCNRASNVRRQTMCLRRTRRR